jgi:pimeloyl-ACP methyl ester carboxylesterase
MTYSVLNLQRDDLQLSAMVEGSASGPANGPVAMLVHGFPDTPHSWHAVAEGLVQAGYLVVRPWLRGYTTGSVSSNADYDPFNAGLDLLAWRNLFEGRDVHLIGHDWGAVAGMAAAATDPQAWKTLSLLAIPPFQRVERAWRLMPKQLLLSAYMLEMQSTAAPARLVANQFGRIRALWNSWSPGWQYAESEIQPVLDAFSNPGVAWAATRYYRSLFTLHRGVTRAIYSLSRKPLNVPTLVLAGENDGCMQAALQKPMVDTQYFPKGVRACTLSGCGHFLQAEQPGAVLQELLAHLHGQDRIH